jgi:hypothetical protein
MRVAWGVQASKSSSRGSSSKRYWGLLSWFSRHEAEPSASSADTAADADEFAMVAQDCSGSVVLGFAFVQGCEVARGMLVL